MHELCCQFFCPVNRDVNVGIELPDVVQPSVYNHLQAGCLISVEEWKCGGVFFYQRPGYWTGRTYIFISCSKYQNLSVEPKILKEKAVAHHLFKTVRNPSGAAILRRG